MSKTKKNNTSLICTAGEYYWLKMQLADASRKLNASLFSDTIERLAPLSKAEQQDTSQAYMVLIDFYQRAIQAFEVKPGTQVSNSITISDKFIQNLKTLDYDGLINIEVKAKKGP